MALSIQHWIKTEEAQQLVADQVTFCIGGTLFQSHKQVPFVVHERNLTDEEMKSIVDVDGTINRIHMIRRQRLEARHREKGEEYARRRADVRERRSKIRQSIKEDMELKIAPSPADYKEIQECDDRMMRLQDLSTEESLAAARALEAQETKPAEPVLEQYVAPPKEQTTCPDSGSQSPPGHRSPDRWLRGHRMPCKRKMERKAG
jgi:hypothetical protein